MISLKSEITKKMLNYFFLNPHESLYTNELSRKLRLDKRNLAKKIRELEIEGILTHEVKGNLKLYSINMAYPLYDEYRKIILKTIGFEEGLKEALSKVDGIKKAYIYGSYARDKLSAHSDIDLFVVGEHDIITLQKMLNKLQQDMGREINVINMDEPELKKRLKRKDTFVCNIVKQENIRLI